MPYNNDNLYLPKDFTTLEQDLLNDYNTNFNLNLKPDDFRHTNIYSVFLVLLQQRLINENNIGLLYSKIIEFIKSKQELEVNPKGATFVGLENTLLALKDAHDNAKDLITTVILADNNNYPETCNIGEAYIVLDYDNTPQNNALIGECLAKNAPLSTTFLGDINYTAVSPNTNNTYTFKWKNLTTVGVKVKLHYQYDKNYYGDRLQEVTIKNNYYDNFNLQYKPGQDLLPAKINDISYYPSLAYVNTEISIDGGNTYLPLNQIIAGKFDVKYAILNASTDITLVLER